MTGVASARLAAATLTQFSPGTICLPTLAALCGTRPRFPSAPSLGPPSAVLCGTRSRLPTASPVAMPVAALCYVPLPPGSSAQLTRNRPFVARSAGCEFPEAATARVLRQQGHAGRRELLRASTAQAADLRLRAPPSRVVAMCRAGANSQPAFLSVHARFRRSCSPPATLPADRELGTGEAYAGQARRQGGGVRKKRRREVRCTPFQRLSGSENMLSAI